MFTFKSARAASGSSGSGGRGAQDALQRGSPGHSIYTSDRMIGKIRCLESGEPGGDTARTELLPGRGTGAGEEKLGLRKEGDNHW